MSHPGIVPVYELGQTPEGVPYYTMRFVRGSRTLATAIEEHLARPEHAWYTGNLTPEEREKRKAAQEEFKSRYGKD